MKILLVHNRYQRRGGEDAVLEAEKALLETAGTRVILYERSNDELASSSRLRNPTLAVRTVFAHDSYRHIRALIRAEKPDIVHCHNTFPLISPAAYYACQAEGVPVIQTLHNYRLLCPAATFFRHGTVCEDCVQHGPWNGVLHGCYRSSRSATAAVALMLSLHRGLRTWSRMVDCYIALSEFARRKFIASGLPADKIVVKPNFVYPDPGYRDEPGEYALFVGRLDPEKGIATLLSACERSPHIPLAVVGDGPLRPQVRQWLELHTGASVRFEGHLPHEKTIATMRQARFLVFPSEWYECLPTAILEAFACGRPVIASHLGVMPELVKEGHTGLTYAPGDGVELAERIRWAWNHPDEMRTMGLNARVEYEARYSAAVSCRVLLDVYHQVIARHLTSGLQPLTSASATGN